VTNFLVFLLLRHVLLHVHYSCTYEEIGCNSAAPTQACCEQLGLGALWHEVPMVTGKQQLAVG